MEPNKTYPLYPDHDDQSPTPSTPPVNSTDSNPLTPPSTYDSSQKTVPAQPDEVPWYLRPLTKTTQSPTTSTQTRPFVPREPLQPPQQDRPTVPLPEPQPTETPASPFRSQPLPPLRSPYASAPQQSSTYQRPSARPEQPLKPLSQFSAINTSPPVYEAPPKKPKMRRIIGIVLSLLLVGVIGVGVYSILQKSGLANNPFASPDTITDLAEERFYLAIEKHLQTRYVHQVYEQVTGGEGEDAVKLDVISDFSDPANPKSNIRYDLKSGSGENVINGVGEIMVLDKNEYFGKLSKPVLIYQGSEAAKPKENQWYRITNDDATGEMLIDPMSTRVGLNTPMGEFPVGNFNDTTRQELMQFIKRQNVYSVKGSNEVTEENKKLTHYNIEVNAGLVSELNKRIANAIGVKDEAAIISFVKDDVKNMEVWVSNETGRIVKTKFNREYAAQRNKSPLTETVTTTISYPSDELTIKKPEGVVDGPWISN